MLINYYNFLKIISYRNERIVNYFVFFWVCLVFFVVIFVVWVMKFLFVFFVILDLIFDCWYDNVYVWDYKNNMVDFMGDEVEKKF